MSGARGITPGTIAFWLGGVAFVVALVVAAGSLPERVPLHWGLGGDVDRWGSRSEYVWSMALLGALMMVIFGLLPALLPRLPRRLVNVPYARYWRQHEHWPLAVRRTLNALRWMGALTWLLLIGMVWFGAGDTAGQGTPWIGWLVVGYLVLLFALMGVLLRPGVWRPPTMTGREGRSEGTLPPQFSRHRRG